MQLALVVTTLGRLGPLQRLLESAGPQLRDGDELVIVAQRHHEQVVDLADRLRPAVGRLTVTESALGASIGRNAGAAAVLAADPLLLFPNDTTWFPDGVLDAIRAFPPRSVAGALTVVDPTGPRFRLPDAGVPLDRRTVWSVIEMGLIIRRSVFDAVGGFDAEIGTGASTPWQAGEVTDLLLRMLSARPTTDFAWMPASVWVGGVAETEGLDAAERRRKLRRYGRGIGRVIRRHRYDPVWTAAFVGAGLLFGLRNAAYRPLDGWWAFMGRAEGVAGRVVGGAGDVAAVSR